VLAAFRGKRVLVTGHTGFKGSWLAFLLAETGAEVMGYALPATSPDSHFASLALAKSVRHVEGDVRDAVTLSSTVAGFQPEFVFHLAAQSLVRPSYADPAATFSTNVMGAVNLLDAVRKCDAVKSLVFVTSDKCYENVEWIWGYRENDRLGGRDPYSASKAAAEIVFSSYARSFLAQRTTLGAATARAGNVIGGGDWAADRIVPDCVRALRAGKPIVLRNPGATRPWQHVLEPISGYLLLATRLREAPAQFGGAWNFGPLGEVTKTVHDVADAILEKFGRPVKILVEPSPHHEAQLLQLNCDKARQLLGWSASWNLDKTIEATADWYHSVLRGADAAAVTRGQLREYFTELQ
jgi:CDP-glucose 4,6-dehydratase